jgi:hypothetical protein
MDRDRFKRKPTEEVAPRRPAARPLTLPRPLSAPPASAPVKPASAAPVPIRRMTPKPLHPVKRPEPQPLARMEPSLSLPTPPMQKFKKLSKRKIASIALAAVLLVGFGAYLSLLKPGKSTPLKTTDTTGLHLGISTGGSSATASVTGTLPFTPVVPKDKPQLAKLGSSAYNSQYKSYSFDDSFMGSKVRVSQQELPSGKSSAADLIDKITPSLQAQTLQPFTGPDSQPAYLISNTAKAGVQVVIFTLKNRLFFVQASVVHASGDWINYLNSFQ